MAIKSSDQISIVDLTDGYSVILTNDSHTFLGTTTTAIASSTTTQVVAFCGGNQVAASVNLSNVIKPSGVTVTKDNDATSPTLTIAVDATVSQGGRVQIPVSVNSGDITITKDFTFAIAFTGQTGQPGQPGAAGKGVSSVAFAYQAGSSNTTAPTGSWESSPPTVSEGQYLWTRIIFTYTDNTTSDPVYSVAKQGVSGSSAQWYSGTGITGTSTTATIFSGSGVSNAQVGDMYLNTSTQNTYRCTVAGAASVAKWVYVSNIKGEPGSTGNGVASVAFTYQAGASYTTPPTGTWQNSPPSVSEGQYLWTKVVFTYTDSTTSDPMYSVARQGVSGTSAQWYSGTGITGTSTTEAVYSGSGVSDAHVGDMYINTSTQNTYICTLGGNANTAKWKYVSNIKGDAGEDAITMSITSSMGTIFKNTAIATTLTAHIYKAGQEVTGSTLTALGTIKWYKDGASTAVGTGATLTITAGDVTNKATYVAQLES